MLWLEETTQKPPPVSGDDPKHAAELERLEARLARHNREAALLAGMRQKPKKP